MDPHEAFGVTLDVCRTCAGIWFDDEELNRVQQAGSGAMAQIDASFLPAMERKKEPAAVRNCPSCPGPVEMEEYTYMYASPVDIDACPSCHGIWVQDGELQVMENLLRNAKTAPVTAQEMHMIKAAEEVAKHEQFLGRQRFLRNVLRVFTARRPFWP